MTRINCVSPSDLTSKHLVAEYRELPRIFGLVRKAIERGEHPDLSAVPSYTLGKGHVRFFYPRLRWLAERHASLVTEMLHRGYAPQFTDDLAEVHQDVPAEWWGTWSPDETALSINRARIEDRLGATNGHRVENPTSTH